MNQCNAIARSTIRSQFLRTQTHCMRSQSRREIQIMLELEFLCVVLLKLDSSLCVLPRADVFVELLLVADRAEHSARSRRRAVQYHHSALACFTEREVLDLEIRPQAAAFSMRQRDGEPGVVPDREFRNSADVELLEVRH